MVEMSRSNHSIFHLVMGNWAPTRAVFWMWKWVTLLAFMLPWVGLKTMLWDGTPFWTTYADLAGLATLGVVLAAVYLDQKLLPSHLRNTAQGQK